MYTRDSLAWFAMSISTVPHSKDESRSGSILFTAILKFLGEIGIINNYSAIS